MKLWKQILNIAQPPGVFYFASGARDRGKLSLRKGEKADFPLPPELARLARFWEKQE